jgi:hypothetical protein
MKYVKTFEHFYFKHVDFKDGDWFEVEGRLGTLFSDIKDVNQFNVYKNISHDVGRRRFTPPLHPHNHSKLIEIFEEYDFIVKVGNIYRFDIKKFMSGSYKQLIKIDKDTKDGRRIYNEMMRYIAEYYKHCKDKWDEHNSMMNQLYPNITQPRLSSGYGGIFVTPPVVNIGNVMKNINK